MVRCANDALDWGLVAHLYGGGGFGVRVEEDVGVGIDKAGKYDG